MNDRFCKQHLKTKVKAISVTRPTADKIIMKFLLSRKSISPNGGYFCSSFLKSVRVLLTYVIIGSRSSYVLFVRLSGSSFMMIS